MQSYIFIFCFRILVQTRSDIDEDKPRRIDFLTRKDLNNIQKKCNVNSEEKKEPEEDYLSLELWVEQQRTSHNNFVTFFKKPGDISNCLDKEDFCLIIMNKTQELALKQFGNNIVTVDSTHGLKSTCIYLTSVIVLDQYDEEFPTACMFTNRKDSHIYELFFAVIKEKVGLISPNVFMSDIADIFFNAWTNIMGKPNNRLFCPWYVERSWQNNINKIKILDKRNWAFESVKRLQTILDIQEFEASLKTAVKLLLEDTETAEFGKYFKNNYCANPYLWAHCYRKSLRINCDMKIESMHKIIKFFYYESKKLKNLDYNAIVPFIYDKIIVKGVVKRKGKGNGDIKKICNRHRTAEHMACDIDILNNDTYKIKCDDKFYTIKKVGDICCDLVCNPCNICIHSYKCDCIDYCTQRTICKHIHYIVKTCENVCEDDLVIYNFMSRSPSPENANNTEEGTPLQSEISVLLADINQEIQNLDNESLSKVLNHLNETKSLITKLKNENNTNKKLQKSHEPPYKKRKLKVT